MFYCLLYSEDNSEHISYYAYERRPIPTTFCKVQPLPLTLISVTITLTPHSALSFISLVYEVLTAECTCRTFTMMNLLLLLCLVYHSGTPSEEITVSVSGIKGGSVILPCEYKANEISDFSLYSQSENIPVCQTEECSGRVFKEGNCDIIIKDLIFSDAGKYFLHLYYRNDQAELERQIREFRLHIHDEISVKTGEELKMDVLLINADKVETSSSGEWTEVWTRGHGVSSDRLTDSDGKLTINEFTVTDTGTYRVLDSEGEILITVTVTESKEKLDHKTDDTKQPSK
ncbi:uncharacterized protein LOC127500693 isoform X15 [Ctenopharyngodon idella]|uniref:uncharacterized protein LOC127500693 isoform X15 n=1 Tax=Ctenopharyngodon idella TaxID=7959 RepID=UPI002231C583|nr:uncharacterized protein LOC127500693 isoform X15 [Ctenopharyngodon idella]